MQPVATCYDKSDRYLRPYMGILLINFQNADKGEVNIAMKMNYTHTFLGAVEHLFCLEFRLRHSESREDDADRK